MSTTTKRARSIVTEICGEGDIDVIFFGQLLVFVSTDDKEEYLQKTTEKRVEDAKKLAEYLVSTGDFVPGRTIRNPNATFSYTPFPDGYDGLAVFVQRQFEESGIDSPDLHFTTWLQKKNPGGKPSPIPEDIVKLFDDEGRG